MNHRCVWWLPVGVFAMGIVFSEGEAQVRVADVGTLAQVRAKLIPVAETTADTPRIPQGYASEANSARQTVSVAFDAIPLKMALRTIADQSGVRIQFQLADVEAETVPVSFRARNVSVDHVLRTVLAKTSLRYVWTTPSIVTVQAIKPHIARAVDGTIIGKVVSEKTQKPLVGATVVVGDSLAMKTGADGTFRLTLPPGSHQVTIRAVGYAKQVQLVTIEENKTISIAVEMTASTSVLEEVVVTGTVVATERKAITTPITVITADEIEKRGVTRIDELLRGEVPGVLAIDMGTVAYDESISRAGSQIISRGASTLAQDGGTTPLKIFVDGVELADPTFLGTIDVNSIERMEVVVGPQASTIYGSGAMGGVIQIFTKTGQGSPPEFRVQMQYGMLQNSMSNGLAPTHNHSGNVRGSNGTIFSYNGGVSYLYSGQWQPALFTRTISGVLGGTYEAGGIRASASMSLSRNSNGTTRGQSGVTQVSTRWGSTGVHPGAIKLGEARVTPNTYTLINQRVMRSLNQIQSLNLDWRALTWWQHHLTLGYNETRRRLDPVAPSFIIYTDTLSTIAENTSKRFSFAYNTTTSIRSSNLSLINTAGITGGDGTNEDMPAGCLDAIDPTQIVTCVRGWQSVPIRLTRRPLNVGWGGFTNARLGFYDRLFFSFALRGEMNEAYGSDHRIDWTPTTGATYSHDFGMVTVKALVSYGWATRPPAFGARDEKWVYASGSIVKDFLSQLGNPDLKPEYSQGPQGGIEVYFGNHGSFTLNHYRQQITDLIQLVIVDSIQGVYDYAPDYWYWQGQNRNVGALQNSGWEGTGAVNLGRFSAKGTYSWTESEFKKCTGCLSYVSEPFRYLPMHSANVVLSYSYGGTSVTSSLNWMGASLQAYSSTYQGAMRTLSRFQWYSTNQRGSVNNVLMHKPGYWRANLTASHRVSPSVSTTVAIQNLGNAFDSDAGVLLPALGRQTRLGVSLRFP